MWLRCAQRKSITVVFTFMFLSNKLFADLGYVYENLVARMLTTAGNRLFYHAWPTENGKHNYEINENVLHLRYI